MSFNSSVIYQSDKIKTSHYFGTKNTITDLTRMITMDQIHSGTVKYVTAQDIGAKIPQCDGIVTNSPYTALSVKTADCVPILMCDDENQVIAAVHAGWRGTINSIAVNAVKLMIEYGADLNKIMIALGPSIKLECYEVREDFREAVISALGSDICDIFVRTIGNTLRADIPGINIHLLTEFGIPGENIDICPECTCCNPEVFQSYRGSGGKNDIMRSVISL